MARRQGTGANGSILHDSTPANRAGGFLSSTRPNRSRAIGPAVSIRAMLGKVTVMGVAQPPEDDRGDSALPPAHTRPWRHPSELGRFHAPGPSPGPASVRVGPSSAFRSKAASAEGAGRRFSAGSLVVAAALGAVTLFATMTALGVVNPAVPQSSPGSGQTASDVGRIAGTATVRVEYSGSVRVGTGVLVEPDMAITALPATAIDSGQWSYRRDGTWGEASLVGIDPTTGLTLVSFAEPVAETPGVVDRGADTSDSDTVDVATEAADPTTASSAPASSPATSSVATPSVATPEIEAPEIEAPWAAASLGESVRVAAASSGLPTLNVRGRTQRIVSESGRITSGSSTLDHLLVVTAQRGTAAGDLLLHTDHDTIVGLILDRDDDSNDQLAFAVSPQRAVAIARDLADAAAARPPDTAA